MMKMFMIVIVMLGFLSGCSNTAKEGAELDWPGTTQGRGHYFDGKIENNEFFYLYPHPLGN